MSSSITGIEAAALATKASLIDTKATIGAAVVKGTLDAMHGAKGPAPDAPVTDKATFGAAVVNGTIAAMNATGAGNAADAPVTDKATFGAAVVKGTLDTFNATGSKAEKNDYDFQTKVLGAGLTTGKGLLSSNKA